MRNRKNNIIIGSLLSVLLIMAIGYAAFSNALQISGTSSLETTWDVEIIDITSKDIVGSASNASEPTYTGTTANFNASLMKPSDSITYEITLENKGSLDAVLKEITIPENESTVITFETSGIKQGDVLKQGATATYTIKVTFNSSITKLDKAETSNFEVSFNYVEDDGTDYSGVEKVTVDGVKIEVATSGDGLYSDDTELGRYVYKGASPDNYLTLGSDTYRIISVESDGTLKVIKNTSIGNIAFDPGYSTSISGVTDSNSTTGTRYSSTSTDYCYASSESNYYGCKAWGSSTTTLDSSGNNTTQMPWTVGGTLKNLPSTEAYLNTYLNTTWYNSLSQTVQSKITTHTFNVGVVPNNSSYDLAANVSQEQAYKWKGKVGLINPTDYVKANTNTELCGNVYANSYSAGNYSTCKTTDWLFTGSHYWTVSPYSDLNASRVFAVGGSGALTDYIAGGSRGVVPVLYLSSDISLSGSGTSSDPYIVG